MVRLAISVEGQTEERFIKDLLAPHLLKFEVYATPVIVATSRSASGQKAKGGGINTDRVKNELSRLLQGYPDGYVTSLYDFYGFEDKHCNETVDHLQNRIRTSLGDPLNLIPYIQLHEFEALLLSDPTVVADYFKIPALENLVAQAIEIAGSPEHVNDSPVTAPSKRLEKWTSQHGSEVLLHYSKKTKTRHGPLLAGHLTLPTIRGACGRFNAWLAKLETLHLQ